VVVLHLQKGGQQGPEPEPGWKQGQAQQEPRPPPLNAPERRRSGTRKSRVLELSRLFSAGISVRAKSVVSLGKGGLWHALPSAWFRCGVWWGSLSARSPGFGAYRCSERGDGRHKHAVAFVVVVVFPLPLVTGGHVHGGGVAKVVGRDFVCLLPYFGGSARTVSELAVVRTDTDVAACVVGVPASTPAGNSSLCCCCRMRGRAFGRKNYYFLSHKSLLRKLRGGV
ncbi:unnamed protein product, partial [Ectocarpus sp. 12 AP-2014]